MKIFIIRRFLFGLFSMLIATVVVFSLSRAAGDPLLLYAKPSGYGVSEERIEALKVKLGLDKPLVVQYFVWLGNVLRGDFGRSLVDERPVTSVIGERIGATVQLGFAAWIFATFLGVPLGVLSAVKRATIWDYLGRGFALFGQAVPAFWIGIVAILIFAVQLDVLPSATRPTDVSILELMKYFILPTITVAWGPAASYLRLTRSAMLEVMDSEYVKLARAKGVGSFSVIWKHAFRNALIPPLTVSVLVLASFLNGALVAEVIFAWPGIGRLALNAVWNNDFPVLTGAVLMFALIILVMNFLADAAYAFIDPRIRYR